MKKNTSCLDSKFSDLVRSKPGSEVQKILESDPDPNCSYFRSATPDYSKFISQSIPVSPQIDPLRNMMTIINPVFTDFRIVCVVLQVGSQVILQLDNESFLFLCSSRCWRTWKALSLRQNFFSSLQSENHAFLCTTSVAEPEPRGAF